MKLFLKTIPVVKFYLGLIAGVNGNISVPEIFSSNMVFQQKSNVKVWGWAKAGEPVPLKAGWLNNELQTKADKQGTWLLTVQPPGAGVSYSVSLRGYNEIVFENVLVGEVWFCLGAIKYGVVSKCQACE